MNLYILTGLFRWRSFNLVVVVRVEVVTLSFHDSRTLSQDRFGNGAPTDAPECRPGAFKFVFGYWPVVRNDLFTLGACGTFVSWWIPSRWDPYADWWDISFLHGCSSLGYGSLCLNKEIFEAIRGLSTGSSTPLYKWTNNEVQFSFSFCLLIAFATKTPAHQQYNICIGALRQNKKKSRKG